MPILSDFLGLHMPTETFMIQFFTLTLFNFGKHILFLYVLCCKEGKAVIFQTLLFFRLTVHVIISRTVFCKTKQNLINWVINRQCIENTNHQWNLYSSTQALTCTALYCFPVCFKINYIKTSQMCLFHKQLIQPKEAKRDLV